MSEPDRIGPDSSPVRPADGNPSRKPIKPPTITPRRFTKFFTPMPTSRNQRNVRTSRRALQAITNPPGTRKDPLRLPKLVADDNDPKTDVQAANEPRGRKRKLSFASVESPLLSSPLRPDPFFLSSSQENHESSVFSRQISPQPTAFEHEEEDQEGVAEDEDEVANDRDGGPVRQFHTLTRSSNILFTRLSGRSRRKDPKHSNLWKCETASFYSKAKDTYFCGSQAYAHPALPFCTASCNSECRRSFLQGDKR
jgi:hypothetical protein